MKTFLFFVKKSFFGNLISAPFSCISLLTSTFILWRLRNDCESICCACLFDLTFILWKLRIKLFQCYLSFVVLLILWKIGNSINDMPLAKVLYSVGHSRLFVLFLNPSIYNMETQKCICNSVFFT